MNAGASDTETAAKSSPPFLFGLDEKEAQERLLQHGPNVFGQDRTRGLGEIVRGTLREPMFALLLAAALLYLALGGLGEGLFLLGGAMVSIGLIVIQERRSERALAALRELAEPAARVVRGGVERRIAARELVPGDVVLVGEGERLPADGVLIGGETLTVDESTLTGESASVTKSPIRADETRDDDPAPGADRMPYAFAGTMIVRGQGVVEVAHTGAATRLGRIGASLATIAQEPTMLQRTTSRLVAQLGVLAFAFCAFVIVAYGVVRGDWIEGALAGITLAISMLPEEFPMVLAVFMALGAYRLAQHKVLVRRPAVIETLGAATLLCVDKTGTLTENRMRVAALWVEGEIVGAGGAPLQGRAAELIRMAALASAVRPVDPMDRAVRALAERSAPAADGEPVRVYPLRPSLLAVTQAWQTTEGLLLAAKGAPEAIFALCRFGPETLTAMNAVVVEFGQRGFRVLGVASRRHDGPSPEDPREQPFTFVGLVAFADPLRGDVTAALQEARRAGIGVAMITGDYPATALAIAREAGIDAEAGVLTGAEIDRLDSEALRGRLHDVRIFARIMPEQKLKLVEAFKRRGEVVAMTGDGVNDAPALETAHVGIAMGRRGTDVAREAADIVLLDDSFASIVAGVRLGRRIFNNLRKALTYIVAIHIPIGGLALLPILFGLPPVFYPMHVVLLELVIDPVCSLVFEAEPSERDAMRKPPRRADESLFGVRQVLLGILQGAVLLAAAFGLYKWALSAGTPAGEARALTYITLVAGNLVLAFAESAELGTSFFDRRRLVFWLIGGAAAAVLAIVLFIPAVARLFQFTPPGPGMLPLALLVALVAGGWFGFVRRFGAMARRAPQ